MPNKIIVVLKSIGRYWFTLLIITIIIVAFYNQQAAIIIAIITLVLYIISYIPFLVFRSRLLRNLKKFNRVDDATIAKKMGKDLKSIKNKLFSLSQHQEKKKWLVIFTNKTYIFYAPKTISEYKKLYEKKKEETQILEELKKFDINSKEEIKNIKEALLKFRRISPISE